MSGSAENGMIETPTRTMRYTLFSSLLTRLTLGRSRVIRRIGIEPGHAFDAIVMNQGEEFSFHHVGDFLAINFVAIHIDRERL